MKWEPYEVMVEGTNQAAFPALSYWHCEPPGVPGGYIMTHSADIPGDAWLVSYWRPGEPTVWINGLRADGKPRGFAHRDQAEAAARRHLRGLRS